MANGNPPARNPDDLFIPSAENFGKPTGIESHAPGRKQALTRQLAGDFAGFAAQFGNLNVVDGSKLQRPDISSEEVGRGLAMGAADLVQQFGVDMPIGGIAGLVGGAADLVTGQPDLNKAAGYVHHAPREVLPEQYTAPVGYHKLMELNRTGDFNAAAAAKPTEGEERARQVPGMVMGAPAQAASAITQAVVPPNYPTTGAVADLALAGLLYWLAGAAGKQLYKTQGFNLPFAEPLVGLKNEVKPEGPAFNIDVNKLQRERTARDILSDRKAPPSSPWTDRGYASPDPNLEGMPDFIVGRDGVARPAAAAGPAGPAAGPTQSFGDFIPRNVDITVPKEPVRQRQLDPEALQQKSDVTIDGLLKHHTAQLERISAEATPKARKAREKQAAIVAELKEEVARRAAARPPEYDISGVPETEVLGGSRQAIGATIAPPEAPPDFIPRVADLTEIPPPATEFPRQLDPVALAEKPQKEFEALLKRHVERYNKLSPADTPTAKQARAVQKQIIGELMAEKARRDALAPPPSTSGPAAAKSGKKGGPTAAGGGTMPPPPAAPPAAAPVASAPVAAPVAAAPMEPPAIMPPGVESMPVELGEVVKPQPQPAAPGEPPQFIPPPPAARQPIAPPDAGIFPASPAARAPEAVPQPGEPANFAPPPPAVAPRPAGAESAFPSAPTFERAPADVAPPAVEAPAAAAEAAAVEAPARRPGKVILAKRTDVSKGAGLRWSVKDPDGNDIGEIAKSKPVAMNSFKGFEYKGSLAPGHNPRAASLAEMQTKIQELYDRETKPEAQKTTTERASEVVTEAKAREKAKAQEAKTVDQLVKEAAAEPKPEAASEASAYKTLKDAPKLPAELVAGDTILGETVYGGQLVRHTFKNGEWNIREIRDGDVFAPAREELKRLTNNKIVNSAELAEINGILAGKSKAKSSPEGVSSVTKAASEVVAKAGQRSKRGAAAQEQPPPPTGAEAAAGWSKSFEGGVPVLTHTPKRGPTSVLYKVADPEKPGEYRYYQADDVNTGFPTINQSPYIKDGWWYPDGAKKRTSRMRLSDERGSVGEAAYKLPEEPGKERRNPFRYSKTFVEDAKASMDTQGGHLRKLRESFSRNAPPPDWRNPIQEPEGLARLGERVGAAFDSISRLRYNFDRIFTDAISAYLDPNRTQVDSSFMRAITGFSARRNKMAYELIQMEKDLKARIGKNWETGRALFAYLEHGGGLAGTAQAAETVAKLQASIRRLEEASRDKSGPGKFINEQLIRKYRNGIEIAKDPYLSQQAVAIRTYFDNMFDEAYKLGMLSHAVKDFVHRRWGWRWKENPEAASLVSWADAVDNLDPINQSSGILKPNASFMRKRIWDSTVNAEAAGWRLRNDHIGSAVADYADAFGRASNARILIRELWDAKASDGRPLLVPSGYRKIIERGIGDAREEFSLINQHGKPRINWNPLTEESVTSQDYKTIPVPQFRRWKFVGEGPGGEPVYLEADALVHPEFYKHLRNILEPSMLEKSQFFRGWRKASSTIKRTVTGMSGFHAGQELYHGAIHAIDPTAIFRKGPLDINSKRVVDALNAGVELYDIRSEMQFAEGVQGGGLLAYIPGIGRAAEAIDNLTFREVIPRLKVELYERALARNMERYKPFLDRGQWTDFTVQRITADQVNAAFGMLNSNVAGRSRLFRDISAMMFFAPDFLYARAKMTGQAFKPYALRDATGAVAESVPGIIERHLVGNTEGKSFSQNLMQMLKHGGNEQFQAIAMRGIIGGFVLFRVLNALTNNGDTHPEKPYSWVIGDKVLTPRTLPYDLYHFMLEPQAFFLNRTNIMGFRAVMEFLTQTYRGQPAALSDALVEQIKSIAPIFAAYPIREFTSQGKVTPTSLAQALGAFVGIDSRKNRTLAEEYLKELSKRHPTIISDKEAMGKYTAKARIREALRSGQIPDEADRMKLSPNAYAKTVKEARLDDFEMLLHSLTVPQKIELLKASRGEHLPLATRSWAGGLLSNQSSADIEQEAAITRSIRKSVAKGGYMEKIPVEKHSEFLRELGKVLAGK